MGRRVAGTFAGFLVAALLLGKPTGYVAVTLYGGISASLGRIGQLTGVLHT